MKCVNKFALFSTAHWFVEPLCIHSLFSTHLILIVYQCYSQHPLRGVSDKSKETLKLSNLPFHEGRAEVKAKNNKHCTMPIH